MQTSEVLKQGQIYTRHQLRELFDIADKTMDTGIYKPPDHDSIWLFVTEEKPSEMTSYADHLDGDTLYWQGQLAGLKDKQIIEHEANGLELVVFHRPRKDAYDGYGFSFEGPFAYVSHSGSQPTSFVLRREGVAGLTVDQAGAPAEGAAAPEGADCLIDVLAALRQSGRDSVVAEGAVTAMQAAMHVPDAIEGWVAERVLAWRESGASVPLLVVLSGNAGDGKSDLIERLRVREELADADLDVIADATHAESPSQSQAERLVRDLHLFASDAPRSQNPRCVLVAMNVGMVIAFFDALRDGPDEERFAQLRAVLENRLGLTQAAAEPPPEWECEVVNLDHRNVLGRDHNGLLAGMLSRLDPEEPESLTFEAARACAECPVRGSCWVRTNLSLLRMAAVRGALHELLWEVTLGQDIHLSPRNLWDLLGQVTTGGTELPGEDGALLSCAWMRDNLPRAAKDLTARQFRLVHRRLLYHLLFQAADEGVPSRGPILSALAKVDPIRRGKKHAHLAESEVQASPTADSEPLSQLALLADESTTSGERRPDPLLDGFAALLTDPVLWGDSSDALHRENVHDLALGVLRRACLAGLPPEIQEEVADEDTRRFLFLLGEYAGWLPGGDPPAAVSEFWEHDLVGGIREIFGDEIPKGTTYFRLDTLSPATRFPAYVPVELGKKVSVRRDPVLSSGAEWLDAVGYLPRAIVVTIDTGGKEPWEVPIDLQLFRLLSYVIRGYAASSVDLEGFFRLRYACERLGAGDSSRKILFRSVSDGQAFTLERQPSLAGEKTVFAPASG